MQTFKKIIATTALVLLALAGAYGAVVLVLYSLEKNAEVSCLKLVHQAEEFRATGIFYITEKEDRMCKEVDIHVNARVGAPELQGE